MKFLVRRTGRPYDEQPCPEAVQGAVEWWDRRTSRTPEEFDAQQIDREPWLSVGTDHGTWTEGGRTGIERRRGDDSDVWLVELAPRRDRLRLRPKQPYVAH